MNTKDIAYIALFAAVYAALGVLPPILIPVLGVPITAQSMGPMIAGSVLGWKRGGLASLLFLLLVAIGLPLLSGGRGGLGVFFGPTAGYLVSWPIAAVAIGFAFEKRRGRIGFPLAFVINVVGGIGIIYLMGALWLSMTGTVPFPKALIGSLAFIPGDLAKAAIAAFVAVTVKKPYPIAGLSR